MKKLLLILIPLIICLKTSFGKDTYYLKGKVYFNSYVMSNDSFVISNTSLYNLVHTDSKGNYIAKIPIFPILKYTNRLDTTDFKLRSANRQLLNIYKHSYNFDTTNFWQDFTLLSDSIRDNDTVELNIYFNTESSNSKIINSLMIDFPPKLSQKYKEKLLKIDENKKVAFLYKNLRFINLYNISLENLKTLLGNSITSDTLRFEIVHPDLIYLQLFRNDAGIDKRLEILFQLQDNYVKDWSIVEFWTEIKNNTPLDFTHIIKQYVTTDDILTFEVIH
ncbi:MAG: hypothetical protein H6553_05200 [Chitinophagales bacterium]|nr:hypothetical protein [Chitinophagales bacterium]